MSECFCDCKFCKKCDEKKDPFIPEMEERFRVTFNLEEEFLVRQFAFMREMLHQRRGSIDQKVGDRSALGNKILGVSGELALAKILGVYPHGVFSLKADTGYDLVHPKSHETIDVKVTPLNGGRLIGSKNTGKYKKIVADMFVLMVGEFPTFEFRGFARKEDLINESRFGDIGNNNKCYSMYQGDLDRDLFFEEEVKRVLQDSPMSG